MKFITRLLLGICLTAAGLNAAPDKLLESDIAAIVAVAAAKERDGLARFLREPGPSGDIPSMVALNTINRLDDRALAKVAGPLARRMAAFLENMGGNQRSYAFNTLVRLSDGYPEAARTAKPVFERIAKDAADPLRERASKFLAQTTGDRRAEADAGFDKAATKMLVGVWLEQSGEADENPSTNQFNADGTFESVIWETSARERAKVTFRGKWVVKQGYLFYRTQYCSDPEVKLPQPDIRDKLVEMGTSQLVYEAHDGAKVRMKRLTK